MVDSMGEGHRMTTLDTEAATPPRQAPQTAGAWLREARTARGIHIAALAATLKVPQAKLEALEADQHQDMPDATFVRALAKAMCRALKVDAAPVLALLPKGQELELDRVSKGLNQPFRERAVRGDAPVLDKLRHPAALGSLGLLLAAAAVYWLPSHWLERAVDTAAVAVPAQEQPVPGGAASATAPPVVAPDVSVAQSPVGAVPESLPAAQAAPVASLGASQPVQLAPVAPQVARMETPRAALELAAVRLRAHADTWGEVIDARGQVLLSRLLRSGEQTDLQAQAPVKLRVGNVAGTELLMRGERVDLAAVARDNVARLELQ